VRRSRRADNGAGAVGVLLGGDFFLVFFQQRVCFEFLVNGFEKFKPGELQQLDSLLELGRHYELLA
jgi:hypothetical protein